MSVLQSAYAGNAPNLTPGALLSGNMSDRISRTVEDANGIPFGRFAFDGVGSNGCTATPTAGRCLGVVVATAAKTSGYPDQSSDYGVQQYDAADIASRGRVMANSSVAVAQDDLVFITPAGLLTNQSAGNVAAPGWTFDGTLALPGAVPIERR